MPIHVMKQRISMDILVIGIHPKLPTWNNYSMANVRLMMIYLDGMSLMSQICMGCSKVQIPLMEILIVGILLMLLI